MTLTDFELNSWNFSPLVQKSSHVDVLVNFLLISIWQPNFTKVPLAWEAADSIIQTGQCFVHLAKELGHAPTSTAQRVGCWRCHLISSLCWQEALICGTQEPFSESHIWYIPGAWPDEHAPPWLSGEQIRRLWCLLVCQNEISAWWQGMSPSAPR